MAGSQGEGHAAERVQEAVDKVSEKAGSAAEQAKQELRSKVDEQSTQVGERVSTTASDIRSVAQQLRQQDKQQPAKLAEQAADRAERLGDYLRRSDGERMLQDLEQAARQQPWAFVAGGIALGFVASRFLKASSSQRYRSAGTLGTRQLPSPAREVGNGHSTNPVGSTGVGSAGTVASESVGVR